MVTSSANSPNLLRRLVVLALVLALGQLWISHHLGWGGDTPWIAALIFIPNFADKFLEKVLPREAKERFDTQIRQKFEPVLTGTVPLLFCAIAVVVAFTFSSMTIIPGDAMVSGGRIVKAELQTLDRSPIDELNLGPEKAAIRFCWLRTGPFGKSYRLVVDGYVEEIVAVYPLVGLKIVPERDLRQSPSVLFRPYDEAIQKLASGGTFRVRWRDGASSAQEIVPEEHDHKGSFLVGRNQPISAVMVNTWKLELAAGGISEPKLSEILLLWKRPRLVAPQTPLAPGMTLVAEVRSRRGKVVAMGEVVLGTEALVDIPLFPVSVLVPKGG